MEQMKQDIAQSQSDAMRAAKETAQSQSGAMKTAVDEMQKLRAEFQQQALDQLEAMKQVGPGGGLRGGGSFLFFMQSLREGPNEEFKRMAPAEQAKHASRQRASCGNVLHDFGGWTDGNVFPSNFLYLQGIHNGCHGHYVIGEGQQSMTFPLDPFVNLT